MSVPVAPTLTEVLDLARRLPAADQLRLIARLAPELAAALPSEGADDSWDDLPSLGDETAALPPAAEDSADLLSAMRR